MTGYTGGGHDTSVQGTEGGRIPWYWVLAGERILGYRILEGYRIPKYRGLAGDMIPGYRQGWKFALWFFVQIACFLRAKV